VEHPLLGPGDDARALGHKMYATKCDEFGLILSRSFAAQLERVPAKVADLDDLRPLIVVGQDHQAIAKLTLDIQDLLVEGTGSWLI